MTDERETVEPLPLQRRGTIDYMRVAGSRSNVHGLVELDVTEPRRRIRNRRDETGERISFTAFLVHCLATTIDEQPSVQAYRDWRGRLVVFDDVDVMVMVETTIDGDRLGVPYVVRAANRRSVRSIHEAIRTAQTNPETGRQSRWAALAMRFPGTLRRQFWRLPQLLPRRWKAVAGTVAITSVGMFGTRGGWAISPTNYTLQLTVGGIATKPGVHDGAVEPREFLDATVTFDHDVVDGAPAARFVDRFGELVESSHGLE